MFQDLVPRSLTAECLSEHPVSMVLYHIGGRAPWICLSKLLASHATSYANLTFLLAVSTPIFSHTNFIEPKCEGAPLVQHQFVRWKYLYEDHLMGQTVLPLSSSHCRTSCFFKKKLNFPESLWFSQIRHNNNTIQNRGSERGLHARSTPTA